MKSPAVVPACFEAERLEHQVVDRAVDRRAGDRFDDAARHAEAGVVVAPRRRRRRDLHQVRHHRRGEVAQRVFAALGARDLSFPSRGVRQQIPDRDVAADVLVAHLEVGQILPHRRLEIDFALLDQPHHHRRREGLRDRGDREDRVLR